jgi:hypothetical protein
MSLFEKNKAEIDFCQDRHDLSTMDIVTMNRLFSDKMYLDDVVDYHKYLLRTKSANKDIAKLILINNILIDIITKLLEN